MTKSPRSITRPQPQRGVAMIEVLVAVLLLSLGILGLVGLQAQAIKYSVEAEDRNRAALLANEIASAMWLSNNVVIDPAAGSPSWKARAAAVLPNGDVGIVKEPTVTNSANITITWAPPQRTTTEASTSQLTTRVTLPPPP
jgi:type IV pilus assembly protein PilV